MDISIYNAKERIANPCTQDSRIANPTERGLNAENICEIREICVIANPTERERCRQILFMAHLWSFMVIYVAPQAN